MENQLSFDIWNNKYRKNNESFKEWLDRVSAKNPDIRKLIEEKKFLFGGRTLANRGIPNSGSYSNCYSSGFVPDSLEGIMDTASKIALTFKAQGGQGISLSKVRPKGAMIKGGFASDGIVPFMHIFNTVTESVSQGGSRKGALMMSLDVWHKEISDFITIKEDLNKINKANLSVEIDDEFMQAVEEHYTTGNEVIKTITRKYGDSEITYNVNVPEIYKLICKAAWKSAEPGILFTNRFRNYNLMEYVEEYQIETSNPCGEQPLAKNSACNLSSINISEYVLYPFTENAIFAIESFKNDIRTIVRAMDDVLEENTSRHALDEQQFMSQRFRNIGIGIMGLADTFVKLGLRYGSKESIEFINWLMPIMFREALLESISLGAEKGSFPGYNHNVWDSEIAKKVLTDEELNYFKQNGTLRNCSLLSIAPTGSIGTYLGISTGCEPFFALSYNRRTESLKGSEQVYKVDIKAAKEYKEITGNTLLPNYFITSEEISWKDRIDVQAALQEYVDTAISSTINLPESTTVEDIEQLYLYAWKKGLKGVTIYRTGSRNAILSTDNTPKVSETSLKLDNINTISRSELGQVLTGQTYKYQTACGPIYITVNKDSEGNIVEVFTNSSKNGTCKANLNGETRLVSLALRAGVKTEEVIDTLKSIQCQSCAFAKAKGNKIDGTSCPDIISKCLKNSYKSNVIEKEIVDSDKCPECGNTLAHSGGCIQCDCGYSKC